MVLAVLTLGSRDLLFGQLEDRVIEGNSEEDDDIDDVDILRILHESMRDIVDRLFRLSTKLRSPETRLRSLRAQSFQILDNGVDLFQSFEKYDYDFVSSIFQHYRRGPKRITDTALEDPTLDDETVSLNVGDEASGYLIKRIALANVARRRQFAYWRHRPLKLEERTEAAIAARKMLDSIKVVNALSTPPPAPTISTATQLPISTPDFGDFASSHPVSEYTTSPAGQNSDTVVFPSPPKVGANSRFFHCPYCFTTCARKSSRVRAWQ